MTVSVSTVITTFDASTATGAHVLDSPSWTPGNGSIILAGITVRALTGAYTITGGGLTWTELLQTGSANDVRMVVWSATGGGGVMTAEASYTASGAISGKSLFIIAEVGAHNGVGSIAGTTTAGATTLVVGTAVTTSNNSGIFIFTGNRAGSDLLFDANYTVQTSMVNSASGYTLAAALWSDTDADAAGSRTVQWGQNPGTSITSRAMVMVEIKQALSGGFDYNLLEARVMRGAGRGVMRGVA